MNCEQARQLFDAYLDGELSSSLATELGAHRLRCPGCRRALALLEVSGHIIGSDADDAGLPADFSDRLLSCVEDLSRRRWVRFRRTLYFAGPVAAAAVVVLAFAGVFDGRRESKVAGLTEVNRQTVPTARPFDAPALGTDAGPAGQIGEDALSEFIEQTQRNMADKRRSGESLQLMFDQTIEGLLDQLESAEVPTRGEQGLPDEGGPSDKDVSSNTDASSSHGQAPAGKDDSASPAPKKEDDSAKKGEVEDL